MAAWKVFTLLVVALVAGELTDWAVIDHLALTLAALLVLAWLWNRASLQGLTVTRDTPTDRAHVGEVLLERLEVRNRSRLGKLWLEVTDYSTLPNHHVGQVVRVPGRRGVRWQAETRCARRGRYRLGPVVLRSGDPVGLFSSRRNVPGSRELIVYPAMVDLPYFPIPIGQLTGGAASQRPNLTLMADVAGIRDYLPGDPFGRISWSASARLGKLMVKEFDNDPAADVWLVLDLERRVHVAATRPLDLKPDARGDWPLEAWLDSTEEYAVTVAASLARRFLDAGRQVGLIATGARHEVLSPDRSARQLLRLLETLAVIRADGETSLAEALTAETRRFTRQSVLIVITPATDEAWVGSLAALGGRRVPINAVIIEPETFGPAPSSLMVVSQLLAASIPTQLVKYGANLSAALSAPQSERAETGRAQRG